jgi:putative transposase
LRNHREAIAAMDFFAVPTITFKLLYCFFVIAHDRRGILHFNVTAHPTAEWVCQQLRDAFPNDGRCKYAILDRDSKFNTEALELLKSSAIEPIRTSIRSPWQNGVAERWVGTARRECFDHVIALNEAHARRLGHEFIAYYHEDRTHLGLEKDTPAQRAVEVKPAGAELESLARVGGLHHRYVWKTAA